MTEKTYDARLGDRARSMLVPLIASADGILDAGNYGATWKEGPPDIAVFLGHAGSGLVSLMPRDNGTGDWLQSRYGPKEETGSVLLFSCTNGWLMTTLPVYRQLILDAATDGKLILASPDFQALVKELVESEQGGDGHSHDEYELGVRHVEKVLDRLEAAIDQAVGQRQKRPRIKGAEERWPNIDQILLSGENAELMEVAGRLHEKLEEELQASILDHLPGEFLGAVPSDTTGLTRDNAHVHAYVCKENGLVYLHATDTDEYLGVPFLGDVLARSDGEQPEGHPIVEQRGPHGNFEPLGRLACGISNLPWVVALAKCLGVLIWQGGDCFGADHPGE